MDGEVAGMAYEFKTLEDMPVDQLRPLLRNVAVAIMKQSDDIFILEDEISEALLICGKSYYVDIHG